MAKLLNEGKTDLLPGFVSQRTRRSFKAYLVRGKDGKISFEFEERKAKPGAAKGKEAADAADSGTEAAAPAKPAARKAAAKPAAKAATKTVAAKKAPAKRATAAKKAVAGE
jgi:DNA topoisomerase-3